MRAPAPQAGASTNSATPTWPPIDAGEGATLARCRAGLVEERSARSAEQEAETERGEAEDQREHDREPVEVLLHNCRALCCGAHAAAEHVRQAPALAAVEQDEDEQHRGHDDVQGNDGNGEHNGPFTQRLDMSRSNRTATSWLTETRHRKHLVQALLDLHDLSEVTGDRMPLSTLDEGWLLLLADLLGLRAAGAEPTT